MCVIKEPFIIIIIIIHWKLCLAAATHKFKWVKITLICLIWDEHIANVKNVETRSFHSQ